MKAVLLTGGRGARLLPYTTVLPKPLMPLGDYPILEICVRRLAHHGFTDLIFCTGFLSHLIEAYFGDGSRWGVRIQYSREEKPLGTAGPLSLLKPSLDRVFFVLNGDLLCNLDYRRMLAEHRKSKSIATIGTYKKDVRLDLGMLKLARSRITDYLEKPVYSYPASMGIYVMEPEAIDFIPRRGKFDLPDLVRRLIRARRRVSAYTHRGTWLDIGRPDEYSNAADLFSRNPNSFLK